MKRRWSVAAVLVACGFAGCARTTVYRPDQRTVDSSSGAPVEVAPETRLVAKSRPPIPDVPVPLEFGLDEGRSRNFAAAGTRYVDHVYEGSADKFSVGRFYKKHMPVNGWTLVTDMFVQGRIIQHYEKDMETAHLTIYDAGGLGGGTKVELQLFTSGRLERPS